MPLDANILLQGRVPSLMQAIQGGINAGQQIRQAPLLEALKKQQLAQGQARAQQAQQQQAAARQKAFQDRAQSIMKDSARFGEFSEAQAFAGERINQLRQEFPEFAQSVDQFDEQDFNQAKTLFPAEVQTTTLAPDARLVESATGRVIAEGTPKAEKDKTTQLVQNLRTRHDKFNQDLKKVDASFRKVNTASDNAQGDMSLIFGFMKLLDPGSTVREGEFANAEVTEGIPGRIINVRNRLLSGERLNPKQREQFKAEANKLLDAQTSSADESTALILQQADQDNVRRERVIGAKALRDFEKRAANRLISQSKPDSQGGLPEGTTDNGDGTFTLPDGRKVRAK